MTASNTELSSGTRPVAESHLLGFEGPLTVKQFKGGQSNPTYKLITPARLYVMRTASPARPRSCWPRHTRSTASSA